MSDPNSLGNLQFGPDGLVPVVVQDAGTAAVLMVAFMNELALQRTRETMRAHFWSRSRDKLWKKGETSGNELLVDDIFVNCELNSLLITVRPVGATCHEGYPTCYFRRVEPDGEFTVVRDRWFDPREVYDAAGGKSIEARTRLWYGAYEYLRDHDLTALSGTSRRLRDPAIPIAVRVADELRELAGVLTGEHRHSELAADLRLEATQSLYWIALVAIRGGVTWAQLRPDRALVTAEAGIATASIAGILTSEASTWAEISAGSAAQLAARCHAAMALIAQACQAVHISPVSLIQGDLTSLRDRPYLTVYFAGAL